MVHSTQLIYWPAFSSYTFSFCVFRASPPHFLYLTNIYLSTSAELVTLPLEYCDQNWCKQIHKGYCHLTLKFAPKTVLETLLIIFMSVSHYMGLESKYSVETFSSSLMSNSLWPHGLQHARLPCPSPTSRACTNSCPLSRWCHPTIPSSAVPTSSRLESFPASGSFPKSQFFASSGQRFGVSASASVLPMNTQDGFPLGLTGLIFLQSKGLSRIFSKITVQKHQFFSAQLSL